VESVIEVELTMPGKKEGSYRDGKKKKRKKKKKKKKGKKTYCDEKKKKGKPGYRLFKSGHGGGVHRKDISDTSKT